MPKVESSDPLSRLLVDGKDRPQPAPSAEDVAVVGTASPAAHENKDSTTAATASPAGSAARRRAPRPPRTGGDSHRGGEQETQARDEVRSGSDRQDPVRVGGDEPVTGGERAAAGSGSTGYGQVSDVPKNTAEARAGLLQALAPAIESARTFAERWEERYRPHVFQVALERLVGSATTAGRLTIPAAGGRTTLGTASGPRTLGGAAADSGGARPEVIVGAYEKLARALDVDIDSVERFLKVGDAGKLHILARIDGKTKRELQTKYVLAYLYVKEVAFGERLVSVAELRSLCMDHGCYDLANFAGYLGKDASGGLLREQGEKGARARKYLLTKKGLDAAAELLREIVAQ